MQIPKLPNTTRIHFQNVNGINPLNYGTLCTAWHEMETDIILVNETKLDSTQRKVQHMLMSKPRRLFGKQVQVIAGSTQIPAPTRQKSGGVLAMVTGDTRARVTEMGKDKHGHWVYAKLQGKTHNIMIITTYQVCEGHPHHSGPTTYATPLYTS